MPHVDRVSYRRPERESILGAMKQADVPMQMESKKVQLINDRRVDSVTVAANQLTSQNAEC